MRLRWAIVSLSLAHTRGIQTYVHLRAHASVPQVCTDTDTRELCSSQWYEVVLFTQRTRAHLWS